jgi:hypothetical protein
VAQQANVIISFAWNGDCPTFFAKYIGQKLAFQKVNFSATFSLFCRDFHLRAYTIEVQIYSTSYLLYLTAFLLQVVFLARS